MSNEAAPTQPIRHSIYSRFIMEQTGCNRDEASRVESSLREVYRTLDGLPRSTFIREAKKALKSHRATNEGETIYTTAPADYDYSHAQDQGVVGHTTGSNPKPVRKVLLTDPARAGYQTSRYHSGLHMVADETEFQKSVNYGLVKLS